jgi:23S rRNA pseudouridine1911/1915/1917 synthase
MNPLPERLLVAREHTGLRADVYLALCLPFLARARIRQKIQTGESLLNGRRYATSARMREGDEITIEWRGPVEGKPAPRLEILYEDDWILAVDKPAGIASHPMGRIQSGTAIQFVRERDAAGIAAHLARGDAGFYPRLVNRLDVFTSGVVLVARTREALRAMHELVADRRLEKSYMALVEGLIAAEEGSIALAIGRDETSSVGLKMAARADGLPSVTTYRVIRRLPRHTLVRAFPLTGRQHQIRVHFAAIGHPVWGDLLYKDERLFLRYLDCVKRDGALGGMPEGIPDVDLPARHLLHAEEVAFIHPGTGAPVRIHSPLPTDFEQIVRRLE